MTICDYSTENKSCFYSFSLTFRLRSTFSSSQKIGRNERKTKLSFIPFYAALFFLFVAEFPLFCLFLLPYFLFFLPFVDSFRCFRLIFSSNLPTQSCSVSHRSPPSINVVDLYDQNKPVIAETNLKIKL